MDAHSLLPVRVAHLSDPGLVRESNEDACAAMLVGDRGTPTPGLRALFVIADGMGGHAQGEVASRLAVETVTDRLPALRGPDGEESGLGGRLAEVFAEANRIIHGAGRPGAGADEAGPTMGTTLTVGALTGNTLTIAHVGDCRAYLARRDEVRQLTDDHAWAAELVRRGELTPEAAEAHPMRHYLTRSLGGAEDVKPDLLEQPLQHGDIVVLCSDGLTAHLREDEILACLHRTQSPQHAAESMVVLAKSRGGTDNITVVVAEFGRFPRSPAPAFRRGSSRYRPGAWLFGLILFGAAGWVAVVAYYLWGWNWWHAVVPLLRLMGFRGGQP